MSKWKYQVKGWGSLVQNESLTFQAKKARLVKLLRDSEWYKNQEEGEDSDLADAVLDLELAGNPEDADADALWRIYNLADDQGVWLDPFD